MPIKYFAPFLPFFFKEIDFRNRPFVEKLLHIHNKKGSKGKGRACFFDFHALLIRPHAAPRRKVKRGEKAEGKKRNDK